MRRAMALALVGTMGAACGGDDDGGSVDGDGAPVADAPIDAAGPRRVADSVAFIQRDSGSQIRFSDDTEGPGSCLSEPVAGCEIQTCMTGLPALPQPDAGLMTVTPAGGSPTTYQPDEMGQYPGGLVTWEDGDAVTIEAEGGEVPAFQVDLTGPGNVTSVVTPPGTVPAVVPRDEALLVEWTGARSFVGVAIRCPEVEPIQVRCPLPEGTTGQVPVAALQRLPSCTGATLTVFTEDRQVVEPGPDWVIRVATRGDILTNTATIE